MSDATSRTTRKGNKHTDPGERVPDQDKAINHQEVEKRAYELYLQRGGEHGRHEEDWLLAEAQLLEERTRNHEVSESKKSEGAPQ